MKKTLIALFTMVALAFGAQVSQAACPCHSVAPCCPTVKMLPCPCPAAVAPCCPIAAPCPACPIKQPCCHNNSCNDCDCGCGCNNCCKEKCSWWKFWQNKNCCYKCNKCCDCCD